MRSYWRNYFEKTDALIWVVDETETFMIEDCREELHGLLQEEVGNVDTESCHCIANSAANMGLQRLSGASLLIFANKTDVQGCMDEAEILEASPSQFITITLAKTLSTNQALQLRLIRTHRWQILPCSAMTGKNLNEGLAWVVEEAKARLFLY